ncbi:MAG TPA: hypothetical protein VKM55_11355 [Candidatus Lokiarchaeia archaeon]|nr:hypothetical protein [Candidatus Lokiarchaeia archaeon]
MTDFMTDLSQALRRQMDSCEIYQKTCEKCGITTGDELEKVVEAKDWGSIPAISDRMFKRSGWLYAKLKFDGVPGSWQVSSSTSGDPSYVWRTEPDEKVIVDAYMQCYKKSTKPDLDVMISFAPSIEFLNNLSKRFDLKDGNVAKVQALMATLAAQNVASKQYLDLVKLNIPKTIWQTKVKKIPRPVLEIKTKELRSMLARAASDGLSVCLGGSAIFMNQVFGGSDTFSTVKDAFVLTGGGGWDGTKGAVQAGQITKEKFVETVGDKIGIPTVEREQRFWDNYGITEKAFSCVGQWDASMKDFVYDTDGLYPETKVIAVDVLSGELITNGKGVIRIISPYGNDGAATAAIEESDEITVLSANPDGSVKQFMAIKRLPMQEVDGALAIDKVGCTGHVGALKIK